MIQLSPRSLLITQHIIPPQHKMTVSVSGDHSDSDRITSEPEQRSPLEGDAKSDIAPPPRQSHRRHQPPNQYGTVIQAVTLLTQTVTVLDAGTLTMIGSNVTNGQCVMNGQYVIVDNRLCTSDSRLYAFIAVICQHLLPGLLVCTCFSAVPLYTLIGTMHQCWIFELLLS